MSTDGEVRRIAGRMYEAEAVLDKARQDLDERRQELSEALGKMLNVGSDYIELGGWACETSPTGQCVYNRGKDPALDFCLFCGQPDERK